MEYPNIRSLREDHDFRQCDLASVLHVSQNTYSQYENGVIELTAERLVKLADFYNVSIDYLLGRTAAPSKAGQQEAATPFDAAKRQITNAQALLFELLRGCEKDGVQETGLHLLRLQTYQTALYLLGLCHGDKPFAKPSRYTKPAAEGEIVRCFAKLGLVREKGDSLSFPLVSPEQLSAEYPELYGDFCSLLLEMEEKL